VLGLREAKRVLKPGGRLFLVEHVRSTNALVGAAMDLMNPITVQTTGVNIHRRTAANVLLAGLSIEQDEALGLGEIFRLIVARNA
jgi:SAM-dependent methyltransferase